MILERVGPKLIQQRVETTKFLQFCSTIASITLHYTAEDPQAASKTLTTVFHFAEIMGYKLN